MKYRNCLLICLAFFVYLTLGCKTDVTEIQPSPKVKAKDPRYDLLKRKTQEVDQRCCGNESVPSPSEDEKKRFISRPLGTIEQGTTATTVFEVKNEGTDIIRMKQPAEVSLPCCVTAELSKDEIKPGDTLKVTVAFDTLRRPGNFDLFVVLFPDKPGLTDQRFHLSGRVRPAFSVKPDPMSFLKPGVMELEITGEDLNKEYKVTTLDTNTPHLKITKNEKSTKDRLVYDITWDGELFKMAKDEAPAVYIFTDSKIFDWYPVLVENEKERLFD